VLVRGHGVQERGQVARAEAPHDAERPLVHARRPARDADGVVAVHVGEDEDEVRARDQGAQAGGRRSALDDPRVRLQVMAPGARDRLQVACRPIDAADDADAHGLVSFRLSTEEYVCLF
jgi:hypothetical protein